MTTIKYATKRNETYHFNIRLGETFYRKSLKTDSPSTCRSFISDIVTFITSRQKQGRTVEKTEIDSLIEMLIKNKAEGIARIGHAITQPNTATAKAYFHKWYGQNEKTMYEQFQFDEIAHPIPETERPSFISYKSWLNKKIISAANKDNLTEHIAYNDGSQWNITNPTLNNELSYPTLTNQWENYISNELRNHANKLIMSNKFDNNVRFRMELEELRKRFNLQTPESPPTIKPKQKNTSPLLEEIEQEIYQSWQNLNKQKMGTKKGKFKDIKAAFLGLHLNEITFETIEEKWTYLCQIPRLTHKIKYGFTADEKSSNKQEQVRNNRWEMLCNDSFLVDIDESDLISTSTISDLKEVLNNIFTHAKRKNYITINPMSEIKLRFPENRVTVRTSLPAVKAKSIVDYCFSNLEDIYSWPILLMAYHGMRNKEVTSLTKSQILIDDENGTNTNVVYIQVLTGKTKNAKRKIPIHSAIIEKGFLEFVNAKDNILFDLNSNQLTNRFSFFRKEFDIPNINKAGEQLVLYSFRHNVISMLGNTSEEYKYRLIGHGNNTVTANYTNVHLLEAQKLIEMVRY